MGFEELWDGFEKVCKKTEDGEKFCRDFLKYLEKRKEIEKEYSKQMKGLIEKFTYKVELEIGTTLDAWNCLKNESLGDSRTQFVENIDKIIDQVTNHLKEEKKERSILETRGTKLAKELSTAEDNMKRAKQKYYTACKAQEKSKESIEKEKQKGGNVTKLQKGLDKDEKKTEKADNEYKASVNSLKQAQDKYYDTDMPALLREYEQFEVKRIESTKKFFLNFCDIQKPLGPDILSSNERLIESFNKIDPTADLVLYSNQNRPTDSRPKAQYQAYDGSVQDNPTVNTPTPPPKSTPPPPKEKSTPPPPKEKSTPPPPPSKDKKDSAKEPSKGRKKGDKSKKDENNNDTAPPPNDLPPPPPTDLPPPPPTNPPPPTPPQMQKPNTNNSSTPKKEEQLIAIYNYEAKEEGEIDMVEGEIITLIERDEASNGWWVGRNQRGQIGTFPSNFVEVVEIIEINANFKAVYNYDAEDDGELNIRDGEKLFVYTETDGWYYGRNEKGEEGNFPSNYVVKI